MIYDIEKRVVAYAGPLWLIAISALGFFKILIEIFTFQKSPQVIFGISKLKEQIFGKLWLTVDATIAAGQVETDVPKLVSQTSGIILELGPGSGNQLSRYDPAKISKIYGIEPNKHLHAALQKSIKKAGLDDIYVIVPHGAEDTEQLQKYGIVPKSIDTILSIQVFCSVPDPQGTMRHLYPYLKHGGKLIVYEHVKSTDFVSGLMQNLYGWIWPMLTGNCHMNRPSEQFLKEAGDWNRIELKRPTDEDACTLFPIISGVLTK